MPITPRTITCPTCRNAFPVGRGAISVCPRCGERVLVPSLDDEEMEELRTPASEIASIGVECQLCGSRYYAKPGQLGEVMKCPDCFTDNVVVEAPSKAPQKTLVELSDDEDFKLSDPVDTPRYQALTRDALEFERALRSQQGLETKPLDVPPTPVKTPPAPPRGMLPTTPPPELDVVEDDELVELEPVEGSSLPVEESPLLEPPPSESPPAPEAREAPQPREPVGPDDIELFPEDRAPPPRPVVPKPPPPPVRNDAADLAEEDRQAKVPVTMEATTHRPEYKPVITLPKADKPDDDDYGSEVNMQSLKRAVGNYMPSGDSTLPPELANRKPFSPQTLMFFLQLPIIGRFVALTLMMVGEFYAMILVMQLSQSGDAAGVVSAFLLYVMAFVLGIFCFMLTAMFCFTIVQDTANGHDKIESWPELSMFSWFESATYFAAATFLGGLPGALLAGALSSFGVSFWISYWISPLILLTSLIILFPPILISMLEAGSVMEPLSATMIRSFSPLRKFWLQFYALSLGIGFAALVVFNITFSSLWLLLPGVALLTAFPFIYFRLLGRMAMMYRDYVAATSPDEEEESGPAVRHVIE